MAYDRDLRLRAIKYTEEGHTLAQAAAVFKVNIGTLIGWRKRYRATGDVKMKIRCPVVIRKLFPKSSSNMWKRTQMPTSKKSQKFSAGIHLQC